MVHKMVEVNILAAHRLIRLTVPKMIENKTGGKLKFGVPTLKQIVPEIQRIAKKKGLILRREDELHATIGRSIRELRKARSLTLKQMSRRTKLSVSLLSQIERAESSASVSSLFKVATALDVRITELFGGRLPDTSGSPE